MADAVPALPPGAQGASVRHRRNGWAQRGQMCAVAPGGGRCLGCRLEEEPLDLAVGLRQQAHLHGPLDALDGTDHGRRGPRLDRGQLQTTLRGQ